MNLIHFLLPFCINMFSGLYIIVVVARTRAAIRKQSTYRQHLYEQFHQHKHLILSPFMLVILAFPRLIITFISGCMQSARQPGIFIGSLHDLIHTSYSSVFRLRTFIRFVHENVSYYDQKLAKILLIILTVIIFAWSQTHYLSFSSKNKNKQKLHISVGLR